jgi:hypothetical protein
MVGLGLLKNPMTVCRFELATFRFGKQISVETDTQATIVEVMGTMFSIRSSQSGYNEEFS